MGADFCLILSDFWQLVLEDMRAVIRRWDPILWRRPHCLPPANWSCYWSYQGVWNLVKPFQILTMLSDFCRLEHFVNNWKAEWRSAMLSLGIPKDIVLYKTNSIWFWNTDCSFTLNQVFSRILYTINQCGYISTARALSWYLEYDSAWHGLELTEPFLIGHD